MKIKNPEFITSAYSHQNFPQHKLQEFVFSGRSNVGKSSMINKFLNRKKLAKVSSKPGHTQSINFYNIDNRFYLVDLPGYGFARVPEKVKDEWAVLIEDYLHKRSQIGGIIQIIDARHKPTEDDIMMVNWIKQTEIPVLIAATKADKISSSKRKKQEKLIKKKLGFNNDMNFCFFSALSGEGKDKISSFILSQLAK